MSLNAYANYIRNIEEPEQSAPYLNVERICKHSNQLSDLEFTANLKSLHEEAAYSLKKRADAIKAKDESLTKFWTAQYISYHEQIFSLVIKFSK